VVDAEPSLEQLPRSKPVLPPNHEALRRRTTSDTEGDVRRVLAKLEGNDLDFTVVRVVANSSALFRPFVLLSDALNNRSTIPADIRETVILAIAARAQMQYEWAEHVPMAGAAGLDDKQIAALAADSASPDLFDSEQLLAVAVAHGVLEGGGVAPENWSRMKAQWGDGGALELIAIIGWWGGFIQAMLGALGLVAPDGRPQK